MNEETLLNDAEIFAPVEEPEPRVAFCRSGLYSLLAQSLALPKFELFDAIQGRAVHSTVLHFLENLPGGFLANWDPHRREEALEGLANCESLSALVTEYTRLFCDRACAHCESDFSCGISTAGQVRVNLNGFYAASGLQIRKDTEDPADHIVAELEFMSFLANREGHAAADGRPHSALSSRRTQVKFLSEHLGRWARAFARRLSATSTLPFYRAVAYLLEQYLEYDAAHLGHSIDTLEREYRPMPTSPRSTGAFPKYPASREECDGCPLAELGCRQA